MSEGWRSSKQAKVMGSLLLMSFNHKGVAGSLNIPVDVFQDSSLQPPAISQFTLIPGEQVGRACLYDSYMMLWASEPLHNWLTLLSKGSRWHLSSLCSFSKFDFFFFLTLFLLLKHVFLQWLGNVYDFQTEQVHSFCFLLFNIKNTIVN